MRKWLRRGAITLGIGAGVGFLFVPIFTVESGTVGEIHLDLDVNGSGEIFGTSSGVGPGIPANCSSWHELFPLNCTPHHQSGYEDTDGSGTITACDFIDLDGVRFHIKWVGPTYFMTCFPPDGSDPIPNFIAEPVNTDPGTEDPTCEIWHWIQPDNLYCQEFHIDSWEDTPGPDGSGNGILDECDQINVIEGPAGTPPTFYHIDRIGLNIIVEPGPVQTQQNTWGFIKGLFR